MIGNSVPAADAARRCCLVWLESPAATKTAYLDIALHQPRRFDEAEFTYRVAHRGDGTIDVEMRDFGRWRPEPPGNHCRNQHRGRGLVILREIATDVVVNPGPEGTHVQFRLPAPAPTSVAGSA